MTKRLSEVKCQLTWANFTANIGSYCIDPFFPTVITSLYTAHQKMHASRNKLINGQVKHKINMGDIVNSQHSDHKMCRIRNSSTIGGTPSLSMVSTPTHVGICKGSARGEMGITELALTCCSAKYVQDLHTCSFVCFGSNMKFKTKFPSFWIDVILVLKHNENHNTKYKDGNKI